MSSDFFGELAVGVPGDDADLIVEGLIELHEILVAVNC